MPALQVKLLASVHRPRVMWSVMTIAVATLMLACGVKEKSSSAGESLPAVIPEGLISPPSVSRVAIGSRDVVSLPEAGPSSGVVFLQLSGEPGSDIRYTFRDPTLSGEAALTAGQKYSGPIVVWPPATIWVVATVGGETGPVRRFNFPWVDSSGKALALFSAQRFPAFTAGTIPPSFVTISPAAAEELFDATDAVPSGLLHKQIDGRVDDWAQSGRTFSRDAAGDMPQTAADIVYGNIAEDEKFFYFVIATASRPRTDREVVYGIEIGPSNVSFQNFGPGAEVVYNVIVDSGRISLESKGARIPLSATSVAFIGETVELRVARTDLPSIANVTELVARPYAMVLTGGAKTTDRLRPLYLRSKFALSRTTATLNGGRATDVSVFTDPQYKSTSLVSSYLGQLKELLPEIELLHQMPLYETGSIPFFYAEKEANGYTGLNAFDRGILSTLGSKSNQLEQAQLVAHELAHFHNALGNRISARWFQEGMSEWSAERLLYRHFPRRSVQQYIRKLRFDQYWNSIGSATLDSLPLSTWEGTASELGYSKSLMFFDLLEARVGSEALRKLQQYGVNNSLDSEGIKLFLEQESSKKLDDVFKFWVFPGEPTAKNDPRILFKDVDGDGLVGLEEEILSISDSHSDFDKDGIADDEEFARGTNPAESDLDSADIVEGAKNTIHAFYNKFSGPKDPMAMLRIGGEAGSSFTYTFDANNPTSNLESDLWSREYSAPVLLHPPYRVRAQARVGGATGTVNLITRPLIINGVAVSTPYLSETILPMIPKTTASFPTLSIGGRIGSSAVDNGNDVPEEMSAYNVMSVASSQTESQFVVEITTKSAPDSFGGFGSYFVSFKSLDPASGSPPPVKNRVSFSLDGGVAYIHNFDSSGNESVTRVPRDQIVIAGNTVRFNIPLPDLASWNSAAGTKLICAFTTFRASTSAAQNSDQTGCLVHDAPGYTVISAKANGVFGTGEFSTQVLIPTTGYVQSAAEEYLQLSVAAIQSFERALARPLLDRSLWTSTLKFVSGSSALGTAHLASGAFLEFNPSTAPASSRRYLFVEQLARLVLADMLDRQKSAPPYWVQEYFVHWLTAAALYQFTPSKEPHAHTAGRFGHYACYINNSCNYYNAEIPLDGWGPSTTASTGAVKSMMFAMELSAFVGHPAMSEVMQTFSHRIPSSAEFRTRLLNAIPSLSAGINSMFNLWVVGSGNVPADAAAILATFTDTDGDQLLLFEETALGLNPNVSNNYLSQ